MADVHACLLHIVAVLLVGIDLRQPVRLILLHLILEVHEQSLRFGEQVIGNHLLPEIGLRCAVDSRLKCFQARLVCFRKSAVWHNTLVITLVKFLCKLQKRSGIYAQLL